MREQLVIVPLVRGVADLRVLHHPAATMKEPFRWVTLVARMERNNGIPPYEWPSVCGVVGVVYAKGGPLEHRPWCDVCTVALLEGEPSATGVTGATPLGRQRVGVGSASGVSPSESATKEAA